MKLRNFQVVIFLVIWTSTIFGEPRSSKERQKLESIKQDERKGVKSGRLFSLFNIVQFNNDGCRTQSSISGGTGSTSRNGTCFTSSECMTRGGVASGGCAAGFGVCCLFLVEASGSIINQNCTYIRNPGFPNAFAEQSAVSYTINKSNPTVCFLRIDFETFSIQGTGNTFEVDNTALITQTGGTCIDSFDIIVSTNQLIPQICGQNTGQHMYIDLGNQASESATINFAFNGMADNRMWEIKVSQIPCISCCHKEFSPPPGCLQYHTGLSGRLTTFNFIPTNDNHLRNQEYSICIRQEEGFCCIQYFPCNDANSFTLDNGMKTTLAKAATPKAGHDSKCTLDYIAIPGSNGMCNQDTVVTHIIDRYCGDRLSPTFNSKFNAPICDCTQPFVVDIFTDALEDTGTKAVKNAVPSRGVCLNWMQIPCT